MEVEDKLINLGKINNLTQEKWRKSCLSQDKQSTCRKTLNPF